VATEVVSDAETLKKIGNTPLIKLNSISSPKVSHYAKLESHNPFGSVKDRAAYWMIKDGEEKGRLKKGESIIIEPTSGNTGIALTGIANLLGYKVEIVIPEKASEETKKIIDSLGAKLFQTSDDLCPKVGAGTAIDQDAIGFVDNSGMNAAHHQAIAVI
jgi:cysteine synthase B